MISVVIADSNSFFRKSLREVLKIYIPEIIVEEAADAEEAMRRVEASVPEIVFTNAHLKGKSGLKLGRQIKDRYPHVVVCVFADYDLPEYRLVARQHGVDHVLPKDSLSGSAIADLIRSEAHQEAAGF